MTGLKKWHSESHTKLNLDCFLKAGSVRSARQFDLDKISVMSMRACMKHLAIPYFHSEAMCPLKRSPQFSLGHHAAENPVTWLHGFHTAVKSALLWRRIRLHVVSSFTCIERSGWSWSSSRWQVRSNFLRQNTNISTRKALFRSQNVHFLICNMVPQASAVHL